MRFTCTIFFAMTLVACGKAEESATNGDSGSSSSSTDASATTNVTMTSSMSDTLTTTMSMTDSMSGSMSDTMTTTMTTDTTTDTTTSPDSSGTDSSATDTTGSSGSGSSGGTDTTTTGGACVDSDGPNDDEASASDLGEQQCDEAAAMTAGTIVDMADQDWFTLHGAYPDDLTCGMDDPVISVAVDDAALTVCVFIACDMGGDPQVNDCGAAAATDSPNGEPGCCGAGGVDMVTNCGGSFDESMTVVIEVFSDAEVDCADYNLSYDYDV